MSNLTMPQGRIPIGFATMGTQRVPVTIDAEWLRFLSALVERTGGITAPANIVQYIQTTVAPSVVLDGGDDGDGEQIFILQNTTVSGGGGGGSWTEVEVDFGSTPVYDATFTITDAAITSSAVQMVLVPCGKAATGRTADDWQWDGGTFAANPGTGSAVCYATFSPGPIVGKRKLQFQVV